MHAGSGREEECSIGSQASIDQSPENEQDSPNIYALTAELGYYYRTKLEKSMTAAEFRQIVDNFPGGIKAYVEMLREKYGVPAKRKKPSHTG